MITLEQVEALEVGQWLRHRLDPKTVVLVTRRFDGYEVDGTCREANASLVEADFRDTTWAPAGVVYLWGRRSGLTAAEAAHVARRAISTLALKQTPA